MSQETDIGDMNVARIALSYLSPDVLDLLIFFAHGGVQCGLNPSSMLRHHFNTNDKLNSLGEVRGPIAMDELFTMLGLPIPVRKANDDTA